jgi:hypothetical protein
MQHPGRTSAPVFRLTGIEVVWELVAADVDADGNPDLVSIDAERKLSVLRGKGDGNFHRPLTYQTAPQDPLVDLEAVDLNADGGPDLIFTGSRSSSRGWLDVLLNDGAGHFRRDGRYVTEGFISAVVAADVNSDGIVDLAAAHPSGEPLPQLSVLLGTGAGRFAAPRAVIGPGVADVAVGDLNGDGKLDVALRNNDTERVALRLGNGDGTFGPERAFGPRDVLELALADLNHDGKLDLVAGRGDRGSGVVLFLGNGDGTLGAASAYPMSSQPSSVAIADFDGDGNADIATSEFVGARIVLRSGRGDGTFGRVQSVPWQTSGPLEVTDVNGDGRPDLAAPGSVGRGADQATVVLNWTGLPAPPCVVVHVTRARLRKAQRDIKHAGCQLTEIRHRYSRKVGKNRVISQRPNYGAVLPSHAPVHLVVSRGRRR